MHVNVTGKRYKICYLWSGILLSLSISTTNAQVPSGTASGGGSDSNTGVTQMGICVVSAESPCNGVK
jgi:hypothetical protein